MAPGRRSLIRQNGHVELTARADYAVRALAELTISPAGTFRRVDDLAAAQGLPVKFLESILTQLRRSGILESRRGAAGGFRLARPASQVTIADAIRAVDGPLAAVRGLRPEDTEYTGAAQSLPTVWVALRAAVRRVLEQVTLADLVAGDLPPEVLELTKAEGAWQRR